MNFLTTNQIVFIFNAMMTVLSCNSQELNNVLPKVENHLTGQIDYIHEALELVQQHANGQDISTGKINTDGTINFNLSEYDIKALYDSIPLQHYNFHSLFLMQSCEGKDSFAKTPFDDVYSQKYDPIFIEKYGIKVGMLTPVSDKKILSNNEYSSDSLAVGSKYHWFYIDRAIGYKEKCIKTSFNGTYDIEVNVSVDIQFKKGWNFIKENLVEIQNYSKNDYHITLPKKIHFTSSDPTSKEVKWFIKQIAKDEEIQIAKKLYSLTLITKKQFEKWAPKKLGDLSVTTKEYGALPERRKNKNNIHLTYTDKTKKKEIDLYVIDCAKSPDDIEMANFSYAMENRGKDKKDIKPYIAQFSERKKATQFMYKVDDRILVEASGVNINGVELWGYIQKLKVEKLLKK